MFSKKSDELPSSTPPANPGRDRMASKSNSTFSVLGSDLTITGDIQASADLHIDGSVEGDIACSSLVQGEASTVKGAIKAESARLGPYFPENKKAARADAWGGLFLSDCRHASA